MSRFDFLLNKRSPIYTNCVQAEQATDISVQMLKIRQVLEYIISNILNNYDYDDNHDLFASINLLNDDNILDEHLTKLFHRTRITTNQNIHAGGRGNERYADADTAMNDLVEIVIWHERNHGRDGFDQSGFMTQDLPLAKRYIGSQAINEEVYIDVNVDPLQIKGTFDIEDEPINVLEQDVFETQAEYEARIAAMEPVHIGYGILDASQGDGYTNIHFLRHHLDRNPLIRFVQAPVYFFSTETVTDTVIDGELVAKLLVHDHQVYLDYSQVFLRSDSGDMMLSFICWDKTDYESAHDHQARIASLPILPLALCRPVRREYDIDRQTLPFRVQKFAYVETAIPTTIIVPCPRDLAKRICTNDRSYTIFGKIPYGDDSLEFSIWCAEEGIIYNNREALEQAKRDAEERARKEKEEAEQEIKRQYEQGKRYQYNGEYEAAIKCYRFAAERGHVEAKQKLREVEEDPNVQCSIGYEFYEKEKYTEAVKWYRLAAEQGQSTAQYNLGTCYYYGKGVAQNYEEAVKWYRKAAEQGYADAQNWLGRCYEEGWGVSPNNNTAVKWYRKAAEQGYAAAQSNLGTCYYNGDGVARNYEEAVKWYRKAAEQGSANAQSNLGDCYYYGNGVAQNYEEAVKWYRKAAEQGWSTAQNDLGICYYKGKGVVQNYEEAVKWYRLAAEQGDAFAQNMLGRCYEEGWGVVPNNNTAVEWYRKAAEQGFEVAQSNLGNCYYNGDGVARNYEEAVKWYRKAAEQGDADAQSNLGDCYYYGNGVAQNYEKAVKWYRKAAEKGNANARNMIDRLAKEKESVQQQSAQSSSQSSKSGCFITTAVCQAEGKADDCYELMMFRRFRDGYLAGQSDGKRLIEEYYRIAPSIVAKIDALSDAKAIYRAIRTTYLDRCLHLIEQGRKAECKSLYIKMVRELASKYHAE